MVLQSWPRLSLMGFPGEKLLWEDGTDAEILVVPSSSYWLTAYRSIVGYHIRMHKTDIDSMTDYKKDIVLGNPPVLYRALQDQLEVYCALQHELTLGGNE